MYVGKIHARTKNTRAYQKYMYVPEIKASDKNPRKIYSEILLY